MIARDYITQWRERVPQHIVGQNLLRKSPQ